MRESHPRNYEVMGRMGAKNSGNGLTPIPRESYPRATRSKAQLDTEHGFTYHSWGIRIVGQTEEPPRPPARVGAVKLVNVRTVESHRGEYLLLTQEANPLVS